MNKKMWMWAKLCCGLFIFSVFILSYGIGKVLLADDLGEGTSSYPSTLDTNPTPEDGSVNTDFDPGEGSITAVINVQTELGTDPAGSKSTVKAYLTTEHDADGTHGTITSSSITGTTINASTTLQIGGTAFTASATEINTICSGTLTGSVAWDPGSIANGAEEAKDVTVTGAVLGDYVIGSFSLDVLDLILGCQVTSSDTVTCNLANNTGGAVDVDPEGTLKVRLITQ